MSDAESDDEGQGHGPSALDEFRENWQRELQEQLKPGHKGGGKGGESGDATETELQAKAQSLYRTAVLLEQKGKVYDALPFYRKATQIMPDIEFKYYELQKLSGDQVNKKFHSLPGDFAKQLDFGKSETNEAGNEVSDNLYEKFQLDLRQDNSYNGKMMASSRDASVLTTGLHFSDLPPEIVMRILRWVVSAQLDMRSLEQCAAVCKGFYVYARDEEIWRLACTK